MKILFFLFFFISLSFSDCNTGPYTVYQKYGRSSPDGSQYEPALGQCWCGTYRSCLENGPYDGYPYVLVNYSLPSSCPDGQVPNPTTKICAVPSLADYNGDADACHSHGGYTITNLECVSGSEFAVHLLGSTASIFGAGLFFKGLMWMGAGWGLGEVGAIGAGATLTTVGSMVSLAGIGTALFGQDSNVYSNILPSNGAPSSSSKDFSPTSDSRIKVSTDQFNNTQLVSTNTATGKVDQITSVPSSVTSALTNATVSKTTGSNNLTPSSLTGLKSTTYDYVAKTATTSTVGSTGAVSSVTVPIQTILNSDGSTTATSRDPSIAPTVTGSKHISTSPNPDWSPYTTIATWTETSAEPTDLTGSSSGGSSGGTVSGTTPTDSTQESTFDGLSLDDGAGSFASKTDTLTNSFQEFVNPNVLNITCSDNINPLYFDLLGRRFTLFDKPMLDNLPIDMIRNILLFVSAISAIIFTFAGGA